jgi:hypothetical protein
VGTTDPEAAAALVVGPERDHLLSLVGLTPQVPAGSTADAGSTVGTVLSVGAGSAGDQDR